MVRVPENLNGFTVSGFYNVNSWFALGGEFSDLFGSDNQPVTSSLNFEDKVSLDRYVYLFGPQVTLQPGVNGSRWWAICWRAACRTAWT